MILVRDKNRHKFGLKTKSLKVKIQVGARGQKFSPEWTAIDLYDESDIIDYQWDLLDLPIDDNHVDCYVCNAVLEHVPHPELAVSEMFRTLKPGGQIWVEVPFLQFEHGYPMDFHRWTVNGLPLLMNDFKDISHGISRLTENYAKKYILYANADARYPVDEELQALAAAFMKEREVRWKRPRFYSGTYFWGEKQGPMAQEKLDYMNYLKKLYRANKSELDNSVSVHKSFG